MLGWLIFDFYPKKMSKEVVAHKADIGIAFDGDADRLGDEDKIRE